MNTNISLKQWYTAADAFNVPPVDVSINQQLYLWLSAVDAR